MSVQTLKSRIKSSKLTTQLAHWLMRPKNDYRPRWWIRYIVNPFVHKVSWQAIVRHRARLDVFPYAKFEVGARTIIEDNTLISNAVGDVFIGKNVLIGVGSKIIGPIRFGDNILLAQDVKISALNHDYEDVMKPIVMQGFSTKEILVEDGAWIGAGVIITAGVWIGKNAVIGAGSVVTKDVAPYTVVVGNPARPVKRFNFNTNEWEKIG